MSSTTSSLLCGQTRRHFYSFDHLGVGLTPHRRKSVLQSEPLRRRCFLLTLRRCLHAGMRPCPKYLSQIASIWYRFSYNCMLIFQNGKVMFGIICSGNNKRRVVLSWDVLIEVLREGQKDDISVDGRMISVFDYDQCPCTHPLSNPR